MKKGAVFLMFKSRLCMQLRCPSRRSKNRACIVSILDKFDALVNDLSSGLPAEIKARRQQYEHYRDRLLTFQEAA